MSELKHVGVLVRAMRTKPGPSKALVLRQHLLTLLRALHSISPIFFNFCSYFFLGAEVVRPTPRRAREVLNREALLRLHYGSIKTLSRLYFGCITALPRLYQGSSKALFRLH